MGKNTHPLVGKLTLGSLTVRISYSTDTASRRRAIAEGAWDRDLRPLGSVESRGDLNPGCFERRAEMFSPHRKGNYAKAGCVNLTVANISQMYMCIKSTHCAP